MLRRCRKQAHLRPGMNFDCLTGIHLKQVQVFAGTFGLVLMITVGRWRGLHVVIAHVSAQMTHACSPCCGKYTCPVAKAIAFVTQAWSKVKHADPWSFNSIAEVSKSMPVECDCSSCPGPAQLRARHDIKSANFLCKGPEESRKDCCCSYKCKCDHRLGHTAEPLALAAANTCLQWRRPLRS